MARSKKNLKERRLEVGKARCRKAREGKARCRKAREGKTGSRKAGSREAGRGGHNKSHVCLHRENISQEKN